MKPSSPSRSTRRPAARLILELLEDRVVPSTIQGTLFEDANANGARDAGEAGLVGVTVYLDQNRSHTLDAGEASTTTDAAGDYAFSGLADGTYSVAAVLPTGWAQTSPGELDSPAFLGDALKSFATPENGINPNGTSNYAGLAIVGGSLYVVQVGLSNTADCKMYRLDPATGSVLGSPVSVPERVNEITHDGSNFWGADWANDWLVQFDAAGNELQRFALYDGTRRIDVNSVEWDGDSLRVLDNSARRIYDVSTAGAVLGSIAAPAESVGGLAFDGLRLWLNGRDTDRVYELDAATGAVLRSFAAPADYAYGLAFDGQMLWLSDHRLSRIVRYDLGNPLGQSVTLTAGDATGVDFGQFQLGTVTGQVYQDLNGNGTRNAGEPGLAGWRVFIDANGNGTFDVGEKETISDSNGDYTIAGLRPGAYSLVEELRAPGWSRTGPASGSFSATVTTSGQVVTGPAFGHSLSGYGPFGAETRVNTTTSGAQSLGSGVNSVAVDSLGNYVVVWQGNGAGDADGVFAQRFSATGVAQGGEFRVNSATTGSQVNPVVARAGNGKFAVAWTSNGTASVRVFDANGTALTGDITVASGSASTTNYVPSIAADATGNFVVLYFQETMKGNFPSRYYYAQRYNAAGQAQGNAIKVATLTLINGGASVAMSSTGTFVVAWADAGGIFAQRYNAAGKAQGAKITATTTNDVIYPSVAMNGAGAFVVTWQDRTQHVQAGRVYSAGGTAGSSFEFGTGDTFRAAGVGLDNSGNIDVTWSDSVDVMAQRLGPTGASLAGPFRVNTTIAGIQGANNASVAVNGNGTFVIAWGGAGVGDDSGVFFQRYATAAPLQAAAAGPGSGTATLTEAELRPLVEEAIARWTAAGHDPVAVQLLRSTSVRVTDLGGTTLGLASDGVIWIDDNAAGWGWFVDTTPGDDREFTTPGDQGEQGRIDLLSALMHEMGHMVGYDHDADGVMGETLAAGERLAPEAAHDAIWADVSLLLEQLQKSRRPV